MAAGSEFIFSDFITGIFEVYGPGLRKLSLLPFGVCLECAREMSDRVVCGWSKWAQESTIDIKTPASMGNGELVRPMGRNT